ncbi:MAG: hypothetical protein DRN04_09715 [Thermoprotei archaeon]|nr:MAG: hypothetical protein DRN04_09715 [Thermoprotei archaeon]
MPIVTKGIIVGHSAQAILIDDVLKVNYLPGYLKLVCPDIDSIIKIAKEQELRVYKGKKSITISDTVYKVKIFLNRQIPSKTIAKKVNEYIIYVAIHTQ